MPNTNEPPESGTPDFLDAQEKMWDGVKEAGGAVPMFSIAGQYSTNTDLYYTDPMTRSHYENFRPAEQKPKEMKQIMSACSDLYYQVGLLRQTIDLMTDFVCKGIHPTHPNKRIEAFYKKWWKLVNGTERSERFVNLLLRSGNNVVKADMKPISGSEQERMFKRMAEDSQDLVEPSTGDVPTSYTFLNLKNVDPVCGDVAINFAKPLYTYQISQDTLRLLKHSEYRDQILAQLPKYVADAIRNDQTEILLDPDSTFVYHYRKDDWQSWAYPLIYSIWNPIMLYLKLELADSAALDGAISNFRIISVGDLEHKVFPDKNAFDALRGALTSNVGGGAKTILWGPGIDVIETSTEIHKFLGSEKYEPSLTAIYAGLGIPQTLTGSNQSGGTTNNFVGLKTMVERLDYLRQILNDFWNTQFEIVQKSMGFRFSATAEYDYVSFGDEASEKAILQNMNDRGLISDERFQAICGLNPTMEKIRTNRENRERESGRRAPKAGPYFDPQYGIDYKKIALKERILSAEQIGLKEKGPVQHLRTYPGPDPEPLNEPPKENKDKKTDTSIPQKDGRPKNSLDTKKRETPKFRPKLKAKIDKKKPPKDKA